MLVRVCLRKREAAGMPRKGTYVEIPRAPEAQVNQK